MDEWRHRARQQRQRAFHAECGQRKLRIARHAVRRYFIVRQSVRRGRHTRFDRRSRSSRNIRADDDHDHAGRVLQRIPDQHFITADPFEIAGRDHGVPLGWVRTGYRFLAYYNAALAPAGATGVPPRHALRRHLFLFGERLECAAMLAQTDGHWIQKGCGVLRSAR
jgi:hypothetical protein